MSTSRDDANIVQLQQIRKAIWDGHIPLEIRLDSAESRTFDQTEPYLISAPRLSILPTLVPRLLTFFARSLITAATEIDLSKVYFTLSSQPGSALRWHLPIGLLYDVHVLSTASLSDESIASSPPSTTIPLSLTVHFSLPGPDSPGTHLIPATETAIHDTFINSVKEADFLRSGSAKPIMSLGAVESKLLFTSAQSLDLSNWSGVYMSLLPDVTPWRNIPLRVYLPYTTDDAGDSVPKGAVKVVQGQISAQVSSSGTGGQRSHAVQRQTLGMALSNLLPQLFPSRRTPILARPMLHGAVVPMGADLVELATCACYTDGWVNVVVVLNG